MLCKLDASRAWWNPLADSLRGLPLGDYGVLPTLYAVEVLSNWR